MSVPIPVQRAPRLGLALGGGSARGWAHIGVIEALAEAGLEPACIAGCSIGAVVGGVHAAGRLDRLADFARALTKRRVMGLLDPRISGSGLIAGERLRRRLAEELGGVRIEALPVRFGCVATECRTGREVALTRGPMVEALRASYALPGILPPVALDGRRLMDGTLVEPVPVRLARALGAEVVVCVSLAGDLRPLGSETSVGPDTVAPARTDTLPESEDGEADGGIEAEADLRSRWAMLRGAGLRGLRMPRFRGTTPPRPTVPNLRPGPRAAGPGPAGMMFDAFNIMQARIARARLASEPPDVLIAPALAGMGLFEFHRATEGIALGRAAARAALPEIGRAIEGASARAHL